MRPLVRRAPNGMRYTTPSGATKPPRQPTDDHPGGPQPTPRPQEGRHMGRAKLTDDDVRAIRADYTEGKWTHRDLAYIYGVGAAAIGNVLRGTSYTHVSTEPRPREQD